MPAAATAVAAPLDWDRLDAGKYEDEAEAVARLLKAEPLGPDAGAVRARRSTLVLEARRLARRQGVVESFLQEFALRTPEGLALMCLAEALLRTPDEATRDRADRREDRLGRLGARTSAAPTACSSTPRPGG